MISTTGETPSAARFSEPSAWTFRRIMAWASLRPVRGVFDKSYRPADLNDPAEMAKAMAPYRTLTAAPPGTGHAIEKTVWMLWQQGWESAPDLVRACAESWQQKNPGWNVVLLDQESLPAHATGYADLVPPQLSRQHRADLARTILLREHGGVWADATLYCVRPLDEWLPYAARADFFMFSWPRPYRIADNWFIVGKKGNRFISGMLEIFLQYVRTFTRPHHYFWMIYLIEYLVKNDAEMGRIWDEMPKLSAVGPHVVAQHAFDADPHELVLRVMEEKLIPVYKFKHKWTAPDLSGTPLERLTGLKSIKGSKS